MSYLDKLIYGGNEYKTQAVKLRAGQLALFYESGSLRNISLGNITVISHVYPSLRNSNWVEIRTRILKQKIESREDSFRISFDALKELGAIRYLFKCEITGSSSSAINFNIKGTALSNFECNRLGFCVLYPTRQICGKECDVEHPDGSIEQIPFPYEIAPTPLFTDICQLTHQVYPGFRFRVDFEGELFEMEDQRNWSDNSFKAYARPLYLPYPLSVPEGSITDQSIRMSLIENHQESQEPSYHHDELPTLIILPKTIKHLPRIGLCASENQIELDSPQVERLRSLHLNHISVDLHLNNESFSTRLEKAWMQAKRIGASLEIALIFSDNYMEELADLETRLLELKPTISLWLIFRGSDRVTPASLIKMVRPRLQSLYPATPVGGGTRAYFADLNRNRDIHSFIDVLCYSLNPQVHVNDNLSLMESVSVQGDMVQNAKKWSGGKPVAVTPVTLRPQINPLSGEPFPSGPDELPFNVDSRQSSLLAACWTLGSLKYLSESEADSITYYETTGWAGVMETSAGSPMPSRFMSFPDCVFPLYHVLADLGEYPINEIREVVSNQPEQIIGFAIQSMDLLRLMVANLCDTKKEVSINGLEYPISLRSLDESNVELAMRDPEKWRSQSINISAEKKKAGFMLHPYAIITIDCSLKNESPRSGIEELKSKKFKNPD